MESDNFIKRAMQLSYVQYRINSIDKSNISIKFPFNWQCIMLLNNHLKWSTIRARKSKEPARDRIFILLLMSVSYVAPSKARIHRFYSLSISILMHIQWIYFELKSQLRSDSCNRVYALHPQLIIEHGKGSRLWYCQ